MKAKGFQGALPILLSVGFVAAIVALAARKLMGWEGPRLALGAGLIGLYLLWLAVEARVAVGEIDREKTSHDRGTLELYAFGRFATVIAALALETFHAFGAMQPAVGLAVFLAGVTLRLVAIRELGRFYSHRVRVAEGHRIVDTGPYRFVRHPAYTGMLLAHAGFVAAFFNWPCVALLALVFLPAVVLRIRVEEEALQAIPGYPEYSRGRKRLVPLLW